ncbi:putative tyramine receptor 2 [Dreissena polymorpha]|nr:putative tyramine receptor 2 [Dreissena polymorpha]
MVCYPQKFKDIYTVRNSVFMLIGVVIFSILLSLPPMIGWSEYVYTPSHSFCFADWQNHMYYAFFMIGCCFGIPFMVMLVCNVLIMRTVRASRLRLRNRQTVDTKRENISTESNLVSSKRFPFIVSFLRSMIERKNKTRPKDSPLVSNSNSHSKSEPSSAQTHTIVDCLTAENLDPFNNTLKTSSSEVQVSSNCVSDTTTTHTPPTQSPSSTYRLIYQNWKQSSEKQHSIGGSPEPSIYIEPSSDVSLVVPSNSETEINGHSSEHDVQMEIPKSRQSPSRRREEIRLAFSLIIVVVVFVICWLPYCISMLLSIFYAGPVPRGFRMFTIIIGYANSCCNPIIYGVMNKRFKVGFRRIFCFWRDRSCS